jgi:hypothetical protein
MTLKFKHLHRQGKNMNAKSVAAVAATKKPLTQRFAERIQDPMGGVIAASVATMGSLGVVLAGSWFIHMVIN